MVDVLLGIVKDFSSLQYMNAVSPMLVLLHTLAEAVATLQSETTPSGKKQAGIDQGQITNHTEIMNATEVSVAFFVLY